jgi:hypothetical protein
MGEVSEGRGRRRLGDLETKSKETWRLWDLETFGTRQLGDLGTVRLGDWGTKSKETWRLWDLATHGLIVFSPSQSLMVP